MKKGKIKIIITAAVVFLALFIVLANGIRKNAAKEKNLENASFIQTETLKKRDISNSISLTGSIASGDCRSVSASIKDVEVKEISAAVGDYVNAGDTIIVFDSEDLEEELADTKESYEVSELKENQTLKKAQDNVEDAQTNYNSQAQKQADNVSQAKTAYDAAESAKSQAESTYESAKKAAEKAKKAYEKLKKKKDSLKSDLESAGRDAQEKSQAAEQAKSAYETAEAAIKYAKEEDENYAALYEAYTNAYNAYEAANKAAEEAKAGEEQAKAAYDAIEAAKQKYEEAKAAEEQAKSSYETASSEASKKSTEYNSAVTSQEETNAQNAENIEESKSDLTVTSKEVENNLKNQKKQVQEAEEKLGECVITSPITGVITAVNVEAGDTYTGESVLFVVQDLSRFIVEASVDEYDIADIEKNQEAVVKTDATGDEELKGVVTYVAPTPEESEGSDMGNSNSSSTASYTVKIALEDTSDRLRIGMTAKTSIVLESAKDVFAVAYDCIRTDGDGKSYVSVLDEDSREEKQIFVETGMESDYYVEITGEGLEENMRIVTPIASVKSEEENTSGDTKSLFDFNMEGAPGDNNGPGGQNGRNHEDGNMPGGGAPGGF